jgi:hypothetical protein
VASTCQTLIVRTSTGISSITAASLTRNHRTSPDSRTAQSVASLPWCRGAPSRRRSLSNEEMDERPRDIDGKGTFVVTPRTTHRSKCGGRAWDQPFRSPDAAIGRDR